MVTDTEHVNEFQDCSTIPEKQYMYSLWWHEECGPINTKSTLDRTRLPVLIEEFRIIGWTDQQMVSAVVAMNDYLLRTDEELVKIDGGHSLMGGWGGLNLQVVELS